MRPPPPDQADRDRAIASGANLAVTAGAGTGKTTLLVSKVVHKVEVEKVPVDRILALTFTEKAANEMLDRLKERGIEHLERAMIGTIHGFCASVLRRFPLEAGVAPDVQVDEGPVFRRRFDEAWPLWLDRELGPAARRPKMWKEVLAEVKLARLRELAVRLASFGIPEERSDGRAMLDRTVAELSARFPKAAAALAGKDKPKRAPSGASPLEKSAWRLAEDRLKVDDRLVSKAVALVDDFAREFRLDFLRAGYVTFDGILMLVHRLLENPAFPDPLRILRAKYACILVDEFQDTDPVQGEIIRRLAEDDRGRLVPGKLFLVGDPKQSIYSFRGADIVAYRGLVDRVLEQGGEPLVLRTNFRSHGKILGLVNDAFGRLIVENGALQPKYEPIAPAPGAAQKYPGPAIEAVLVESPDADTSREVEAREIAAWIKSHPAVPHKEIAILLRSLVNVGTYLEALRAASIPYAVSGEKYFFGTVEVIDFVNLLRAAANPHDRMALVGVLRSPYGAIPDQQIYERRDRLDCRLPSEWPIMAFLKRWNGEAGRRGVGDLVDTILGESGALEIAQEGYHGEQAVVNLLKLAGKARELEAKSGCTLREFLDLATQAVRDLEEEGESPLADETLDAVKILSIHASKGLEFPVVILPDLHRARRGAEIPAVRYDWPTRTLGVSLGDAIDSGAAALAHLARQREHEERRRLLYVAATRAKDRLLLLGREKAGAETSLDLLRPDLERHAEIRRVPYVRPSFVPEPGAAGKRPVDWGGYLSAWREREKRARPPGRITSPTKLEGKGGGPSRAAEIGIACHRVLERLDFGAPAVPEGTDPEAAEILEAFFRSAPFKRLREAEILARELPFVIPSEGRIVQGVIDVVYRAGGKLCVADYKTDTIVKPEEHGRVRGIYAEAVRRALGEEPRFSLIYLRHGREVES